MNPDYSVIIPTYNRLEVLPRAVKSVLEQKHKNFELILVDDGSTDGTSEWLNLQMDSRIRVIRLLENRGVSHARNVGIKTSCGTYLAFLDSDDEWLPSKLQKQWEVLLAQKAMVCHTEEIWIRNGVRVNQCDHHKKQGGPIFSQSLKLCAMSPSSIIIHQEVLKSVGLFDESLPACEDYDLWLKITAKYPVHFISEPQIIKYGGHEDQLSKTVEALDRYRIQSLVNLYYNFTLSDTQKLEVYEELLRRIRIYKPGCVKRGRMAEAEHLDKISEDLQRIV